MKKLILIMLCSLLLCGCETEEKSESVPVTTEQITTEAETEAPGLFSADVVEEAQKALDESGIDVSLSKTYRNDKTGNWRLARIATSAVISNHALDYYHGYFMDNKEVHIVINFSLKTTTCIKYMAGTLYVDVYDYVEKEEHDAGAAMSGTHLASYQIDTETGEVSEIK